MDLWTTDPFLHSETSKRAFLIGSAHHVVMLSNILQKSITPLDISICEVSRKMKTVATELSLHRYLDEENEIINSLNLYSPIHFDHRFQSVDNVKTNDIPDDTFRAIKYIHVLPSAHQSHFYHELLQLVENSTDKMVEIRKCVNAIARIGLCRDLPRPRFYRTFFNYFIDEKCEDSHLVMKFTKACISYIFIWILTNKTTNHILEYVLLHSQRANFNVFELDQFIRCPLDYSIKIRKAPVIELLLKYGYSSLGKSTEPYYFSLHRGEDIDSPPFTIRRDMPVRRTQLLNELLCLSHASEEYPLGLPSTIQLLWRSRPDYHLRKSEVENSLAYSSAEEDLGNKAYLRNVWSFYKRACTEGQPGETHQPRTLCHFSRCEVRRILGHNYALPHGIDSLEVPDSLKSYLRLEC